MYKFAAIVAAALLTAVWHSQIAGLVLIGTLIAVFLSVIFKSTSDTGRPS
jgi:hypothetical protein